MENAFKLHVVHTYMKFEINPSYTCLYERDGANLIGEHIEIVTRLHFFIDYIYIVAPGKERLSLFQSGSELAGVLFPADSVIRGPVVSNIKCGTYSIHISDGMKCRIGISMT